ncbi:MAG: hypothetical protein RLZZ237_2835, partial [Pseudomonadota bacterium]
MHGDAESVSIGGRKSRRVAGIV